MHGQDALERAAVDVGVQHRDRRRLPGALQVALVGDQQGTALAAPVDDLAQVLGRQHPAGGVRGAVHPHQRRAARARARCSESVATVSAPDQRRADLVGRVGELGLDDQVTRARGPGRWAARRSAPWSRPSAAPRRDRDRPRRSAAPASPGRPAGSRAARSSAGSPGSRRRRPAPAGRPRASGRPGCRPRGRRCRRGARAPARRTASGGPRGSPGAVRRPSSVGRQGHSWFWGGSAAIIGWSLSISPILAAPPGEPRSSKKCTLAS